MVWAECAPCVRSLCVNGAVGERGTDSVFLPAVRLYEANTPVADVEVMWQIDMTMRIEK